MSSLLQKISDGKYDAKMSLGIEAFFKCVQDTKCAPSKCEPCLYKFTSYLYSAEDYNSRVNQEFTVRRKIESDYVR